ncbi:serine/threonine-protein kinase HAL4/sat4 [Blyttiomyces sp. JEL0837]|nr:serine/threonine-protein kinase HAL4/sat4 [Blyttiomyces sp. JEL0837]
MSTFGTDIWTPGLDNMNAPSGRGSQSSNPSRKPSTSSKTGSPQQERKHGSNHHGLSMAGMFSDNKSHDKAGSSSSLNRNNDNGKRPSILYRIFHPHEGDGAGIMGRSRRSYNSGSESELESEDEHHSDMNSSDNEQGFNSLGRSSAGSRSLPRLSQQPDSSHRNTMSLSRTKYESGDSDSESETEQNKSSMGRSRSSIFKDLLHGGKIGRKSSTSSPHASDENLSSHAKNSDSDTEDHHHHNIFKNIMHRNKSTKSDSKPTPAPAPVPASAPAPAPIISKPVVSSPMVAIVQPEASPTATNGTVIKDAAHESLPLPPPVSSTAIANLSITNPDGALTVPGSTANGSLPRSLSETSLSEKYGKKQEKILGKGANAVIRLCTPVNSDKKFAVKEFRKRRKGETQKEYVKKLIAEFCISSSLDHDNVIKTVDLIQDERKQWCVVMEYAAGGDLYSRIHAGTLTDAGEINCYFKQLLRGVQYLHSMGVAHKDLKPENLLIDGTGRFLKITDFGVSEVFRTPFGSLSKKAHGLCGSGPYIAPEEFDGKEYEQELVDVWAIGIIYYVMLYNSIPWKAAGNNDARFKYYLEHRGSFWPIDRLSPPVRKMMYRILEPDVTKRVWIKDIMEDEWIKATEYCAVGSPMEAMHHTHPKPVDKMLEK